MHLIVLFVGFALGVASPMLWYDPSTMPAWIAGVGGVVCGVVFALLLRWLYELRWKFV
jgi:membrane associated rhomboid family serine protease